MVRREKKLKKKKKKKSHAHNIERARRRDDRYSLGRAAAVYSRPIQRTTWVGGGGRGRESIFRYKSIKCTQSRREKKKKRERINPPPCLHTLPSTSTFTNDVHYILLPTQLMAIIKNQARSSVVKNSSLFLPWTQISIKCVLKKERRTSGFDYKILARRLAELISENEICGCRGSGANNEMCVAPLDRNY